MDADALAEFLAAEGGFGPLQRRSGRLLNEVSHAQITGAENLLKKAARSLSGGDAERAERLIDRAAQMPYDPREEGSPGIRGATMLVYSILTDHFEASEPGDMTWLDVVLAVHPHLDPTGRADIASVVHGFVLQEAFFDVTPAEARRIRGAFGDAPLNADLGDGPQATVERRRAIIRSLTTAAAALADAYAATTDNP
ncbi:MAG: hypothetical protein WCF36_11555 [Candidatus Nanopelagicales bacterium]